LLFAKQESRKQGGDKQYQEECMDKHRGPMFDVFIHMQKELGLTDEQVKSIADINKNYVKKMLDYREKLAPKHIHLKKMLLEDNVDLENVRPLLKEISDLKIELHMLRIQQRIEIEKVLTPVQKGKIRMFWMFLEHKK